MHIKSKINRYLSALLFISLITACSEGHKKSNETTAVKESPDTQKKKVELVRDDAAKKVDVLINGELFTSYIFSDTLDKPVLYPIRTSKGTLITRGFPLDPRPGERIDHPHHVGLWFTYGDVNGLDFWNNSYAIPAEEKEHYGSIVHKNIEQVTSGDDNGALEVSMDWVDHNNKPLLKEHTTYVFSGSENKRIIDRITTLTALDEDVSFRDNKEGLIGMRVARELELPADKPEKFTDANGKPTDVPVMNNEGVTGMYRSSEGIEGNDVWGTRAKWVDLAGNIKDENIAIVMMDHPDNVGYPTYWHARGYGLYAANNLGQKAMSEGKEELNFALPAGKSVTFKHRVIIYSGDKATDETINKDYEAFVL